MLYRSYSIGICYGSSANQARDRLGWITRRDREACGDGRWVCDFKPDLYWKITFKGQSIKAEMQGNQHIAKALWSAQKDRYRWEPRR